MSEFYYADSSALIKRHVPETGSSWIKQEFSPSSGNDVITSKLSIAEVLSGLNRRKREASISAADYTTFSKDFTAVSRFQYRLMDLTDTVLLEAQRLLETHPLRAGDAIQLATAIYARNMLQNSQLPPPIFLASDTKLLDAAVAENFTTDNPNLHP